MRRSQRGMVLTGYVVGALALIIAIGAGLWYLDRTDLKHEITVANDQRVEAEKQSAKEEESRKGFQTAASSCSASITQLVVAQNARESWYQGQLQASRAKTKQAEDQARGILTSQRPSGMTECEAMKKELDNEIDRRRPAR